MQHHFIEIWPPEIYCVGYDMSSMPTVHAQQV